MKVSVITVCFNSCATVRQTIESVLSQDYIEVEYIVIDGNSSDGTLEILHEHREGISVLVSEPDDGIYDAMNKGILLATGDIVGILNSDDVFASNYEISKIVEKFSESECCDIVFGDVQFKDFRTNRTIRHYSANKFEPFKLRFGWMPPHPATFVKSEVYAKYGIYVSGYSISADYEIFVRWLLVKQLSFEYLDRTIVYMRLGGASTSGIKSVLKLNKEIIRACKDNGIYTNWFFLMFKFPFKLLEFVIKK